MTAPAVKPNSGPALAAAFAIFALLWLLAAVLLGINLWVEPPTTRDDDVNTLAVNVGAVTVVALCLIGASVCGAGAAVVDQVWKARAGGADRG